MLFIRLTGCNKACPWCDSKFTWDENTSDAPVRIYTVEELAQIIHETDIPTVLWTGGEPGLQQEGILRVIEAVAGLGAIRWFDLETNGSIKLEQELINSLCYIAFSPKSRQDLDTINRLDIPIVHDIKVVTDLENVGLDLVSGATMLMPLTTYNDLKDKAIAQRVWEHCIKARQNYSPRLHVELWGKERRK